MKLEFAIFAVAAPPSFFLICNTSPIELNREKGFELFLEKIVKITAESKCEPVQRIKTG